jgi:hypothetical protein
MNWNEFNTVVTDLLLVDGVRKGRGVEKYRDRQIVAGVKELQSYIPKLRLRQTLTYLKGDLTEHADKQAHIGDFDFGRGVLTGVVVRRIPSADNKQEASRYFYPKSYSPNRYRDIVDGGGRDRSTEYHGRIAFYEGSFYTEPLLRTDEQLKIFWISEYDYRPLFSLDVSSPERVLSVPFGDQEALAVSQFVKGAFARDVDDNQKLFQQLEAIYKNTRRQLYADWKKYAPSSVGAPTTATVSNQGVVGNG